MISTLRRLLRSGLAAPAIIKPGRFVGRHNVCDALDPMAFQFRMTAGNIGTVNRYHPASIEPAPISGTVPPAIGLACVIDATSKLLRLVQAGDTALTDIYGILVRPWPFQQGTAANFSGAIGFGTATPVSAQFGVWDVLRSGYIIAPIVGTPGKGDPVFVWVAASSGAHIQGGFEAAATGGSTMAIGSLKTTFQGPPDANSPPAGEIAYNV